MTRWNRTFRAGASIVLAVGTLLALTMIVSAYTPPGSTITSTAACSTVSPGGSCTITFHMVDANGKPVTGATVTFSTSGVPGSTVNPTSAVTDPGDASTTFTASTTSCGTATVTASSPPSTAGQVSINVRCNGSTSLPFTAADPPGTPPWLIALVVGALITVAAGGIMFRRLRSGG